MVRLVDRFDDKALRDSWVRARDAALAVGLPVIYVRIAFRAGYPEVAIRNELLAPLIAAGGLSEADPGSAISPFVASGSQVIVVTKRRVSAFSGSENPRFLTIAAGAFGALALLPHALEALSAAHALRSKRFRSATVKASGTGLMVRF